MSGKLKAKPPKSASTPQVSGQKSLFNFFAKSPKASAAAAAGKRKSKGPRTPSGGGGANAKKKGKGNAATAPDTPETLPATPDERADLAAGNKEKEDETTPAVVEARRLGDDDGEGGGGDDGDVSMNDVEEKNEEQEEDEEVNTQPAKRPRRDEAAASRASSGKNKMKRIKRIINEDSDDDEIGSPFGTTTSSAAEKSSSSSSSSASASASKNKRRIVDSDDDDDEDDDDGKIDVGVSGGTTTASARSTTASTISVSDVEGASHVDGRVAKTFNGEVYFGTITDYEDQVWHVEYDDGDEEDFDFDDLNVALKLYRAEGKKDKKKDPTEQEGEDEGGDDNESPEDKEEEEEELDVDEDLDGSDEEFEAEQQRAKARGKKGKSGYAAKKKKKKGTGGDKSTDAKKSKEPAASSPETDDDFVKEPASKKIKRQEQEKKWEEDKKAAEEAEAAKKKKKKPASAFGCLVPMTSAMMAKTKKRCTGNKSKASSSATSSEAPGAIRAYTDGDDLPILSVPQDMFDDMVFNGLTQGGTDMAVLDPFLKTIRGRPLRIATMCSGTESPVLALDMMSKSIEDFYLRHRRGSSSSEPSNSSASSSSEPIFQIEHVFSCEIEPFKQAYIERNFQPPLLFRDIRELGKVQACTAYGALADVPSSPGCVDLLVAGTSCVDFSNLNNDRKELDQSGESGQTFRGMMDWVRKAEPPLVILENVSGAPWGKMVKAMESLGYHAGFARVDTKKFYIPQTRQRGYLLAIRKDPSKKKSVNSSLIPKWTEMLKQLQRPASGSLDAFMLPNDDPRVLRGRARLSSGGADPDQSNKTEWTKCEGRHLLARSTEELGDKRPLTGWSDAGSTTMPSFAWNDWANTQVHRIHDLIDINTLRLAKEGVDCTYKTMVWDVSQNVDRDTMGKLGLSQCLTPSGVNYIPNRGGPLVGEELLKLQGIPVDDLLLTKESDKNLKDLAGNAMSTTVVGACILGALVLGHNALVGNEGKVKDAESVGEVVKSLVPRPLAISRQEIEINRKFGGYKALPLSLAPSPTMNISELLSEAASSARKCLAEGSDKVLPPNSLLKCRQCDHTSSVSYATPARKFEEHDLVPWVEEGKEVTRATPAQFRQKLLDTLPMRMAVSGLAYDEKDMPSGIDEGLWRSWTRSLNAATTLEDGSEAAEFRFSQILRSHIWTVIYTSSNESKLELRLSEAGAVWFLFAKAPPKQGALRDALSRPIARMRVDVPKGTFLSGQWEVCLPMCQFIDVSVEGVGNRVDSWEAKLGLKGDFASQQRYDELSIAIESEGYSELKAAVDGAYRLLPKCGTACSSLYKRDSSSGSKSMYFFLESARRSLPGDDMFIFSNDTHRTSYGEYRELVLQMDKKYRARAPSIEEEEKQGKTRKVKAFLPGKWVASDACAVSVQDSGALASSVTMPTSKINVPLVADGWKTCAEILSVEVPLQTVDRLYEQCQSTLSYISSPEEQSSTWLDINLRKSKQIFDSLAFVTSRLSVPPQVMEWTSLDTSNSAIEDGEFTICRKCAPQKPSVKWTVVTSGNRRQYVPQEDGREAAVYEQALKSRPHAFETQLRVASSEDKRALLDFRIGVNSVSLSQSALGLFPPKSLARKSMLHSSSKHPTKDGKDDTKCLFEWRVVPHTEHSPSSSVDFAKLYLTSNKKDKGADQPPNFKKYPLRPEQLRSLSWMLAQEATNIAPFYEEEVVETILPSLSWRAEGRVRRPVMVRGGIVADEVGYGKTAITLGLIDAAGKVNGPAPDAPAELKDTLFQTKATLVVIPAHLSGQWPAETRKFCGNSKKVVEIKSMADLNKVTVRDIQEADIVIVNFTFLSSDKYFQRLARLAGVSSRSLPSGGGKAGEGQFTQVYKECVSGLSNRVEDMKADATVTFSAIEDDAFKHHELELKAETGVRLDGKKAVYKNVSEEQTKKEAKTTETGKGKKKSSKEAKASKGLQKDGVNDQLSMADRDPWGLSTSQVQKDVTKMKCPPLEMFFWNRLVIDEFHYMIEKMDRSRVQSVMLGLKSTCRWCLSGTPPHENFRDVQGLASLLGIYLGNDDALPGEEETKKRGGSRGSKASSETFSSLLEVRSMQWHERRHGLAQDFLNRFLRQNQAEIDEIKWEDHTKVIDMPPAEMAIYLEMASYLKSLDMNAKGALKSKKASRGDREKRMQNLLQESADGVEALLKRSAHFEDLHASSDTVSTAFEQCQRIAVLRQQERDANLEHMKENIAHALRQRRRIVAKCPNWEGTTKTEKGEVEDRLAAYIADVEQKRSVSGGADNEIHEKILMTLRQAEKEAKNDPNKVDERYQEANSGFADDGDDDCDGKEDDDEGSSKKRKRGESKKGKKKTAKPEEEVIFAMKFALREHVHDIRSLGKELCGRIRSLRYFQWVRDFQLQDTKIQCPGHSASTCQCNKDGSVDKEQSGVLSSCGHVGCLECLKHHADREECVDRSCQAPVKQNNVVSALDLGSDQGVEGGGQYGAKLTAIVSNVKSIVKKGDRILVFVQFKDLKEKVAEALERSGVKTLQVKGTVHSQIKSLSVMQKEVPDKKDPRVLLLTMDDESSAGVNLTTCNHAIFVHPLLADTQQQYTAYETQAIGRVRRYGQTKTVHIWRYFARDTIDAEVYKERTGEDVNAL